jgi:hypothetical protein
MTSVLNDMYQDLTSGYPCVTGTPPEDCSAEVTALFEHWQSIHPGGGLLPGRQHFDPLQVPRLLPHLWLVEVHRDPWRFRVRLMGTAVAEFIGRDDTGKWMHDEIPDLEGSDMHRCLVMAADEGRPAYQKGKIIANVDKTYISAERFHLPLAADGHTPDMLLNMSLFRR